MDARSKHIEKLKLLTKSPSLAFLCLFALLCLITGILSPPSTFAIDNSICARVKLEIKQELTLERQGFDAHMRITNGFSHISLEDVNVDVTFSDEEGNSVLASFDPNDPNALFFIRLDSLKRNAGRP